MTGPALRLSSFVNVVSKAASAIRPAAVIAASWSSGCVDVADVLSAAPENADWNRFMTQDATKPPTAPASAPFQTARRRIQFPPLDADANMSPPVSVGD